LHAHALLLRLVALLLLRPVAVLLRTVTRLRVPHAQ
jgi:hypothetical protein